MIIDLGCGSSKRPGAVGVDANVATRPDVVHDLDSRPFPFETSAADAVWMDNVLEHLMDVVATLEEVHRILRPGGLAYIYVPYFRSHYAAVDPTHRHQFTVGSMAYVDRSHPWFERYRYSSAGFDVLRVSLNDRFPKRGVRGVVAALANRCPDAYERHFSWLYPLDELGFVLRAVKP